jgi:23S rRNA pseudouridine1911/1915/1917 synthase
LKVLALRTLTTDRGDVGQRLDLVVRRHLRDMPLATRSRVQAWIESGQVSVNGSPVRRAAARAALGDVVAVMLPDAPARRVMAAEDIALSILYEDEHLLALDKPPGIVVHPTYKHASGTIMNALLARAREWPGGQRPSIVGRLDRLTSGIVLAAKSARVHAALQRVMASKQSEKDYLAVVYGRVNAASGRISAPLTLDRDRRRMVVAAGGAESLTRFERVARAAEPRGGLSVLRCRLVTGRRHQIRAHLASRGWPIVGDPVYGEPRWKDIDNPELASTLRDFPRQALHAWRLRMTHPMSGAILTVDAPIPDDMRELLARILTSPHPQILTF